MKSELVCLPREERGEEERREDRNVRKEFTGWREEEKRDGRQERMKEIRE